MNCRWSHFAYWTNQQHVSVVYIRRIPCTDGETNKANKWNDNQMRGTQTKPENLIKRNEAGKKEGDGKNVQKNGRSK